MAITKEVLDELLKEHRGPEDSIGPEGLLKQLTKALIERAMEAELTEHVGYEKHDQGEKETENRRKGKQRPSGPTKGPLKLPFHETGKDPSSRPSSPNTSGSLRGLMIRSYRCTHGE